MLIFDAKVLIALLCLLVGGMVFKFSVPYHLQQYVSIDFFLTFVGLFALLVYFHYVGFIEGYNKGYEHGKTEMCTL